MKTILKILFNLLVMFGLGAVTIYMGCLLSTSTDDNFYQYLAYLIAACGMYAFIMAAYQISRVIKHGK